MNFGTLLLMNITVDGAVCFLLYINNNCGVMNAVSSTAQSKSSIGACGAHLEIYSRALSVAYISIYIYDIIHDIPFYLLSLSC